MQGRDVQLASVLRNSLGEPVNIRVHTERGVALGAEAIGIDRGERRGFVEVGEMTDLVADRPTRRRRRPFPTGGVERLEQPLELPCLGCEIFGELRDVDRHAGTL